MKKGDRVEINAPKTAWHGYKGKITTYPVQFGRCQVLLDHGSGEKHAYFLKTELLPEAAVDRLAALGCFLPSEEDIGRGVVYYPPEVEGVDSLPPEDGVITSMNDGYVFVRYAGDVGSKATRYEDLRWLAP